MFEQRAKEILLKAKKEVFTGNIGSHLTAFKGDGIDFAEIRAYNSGDDVRKINWKATAKSGDLKLNEFNEERELHIVVAVMLSGGLNFGTKRLKQDSVAEILALLGFSSIASGDRLEIALFSDKLERHFKPTKSSGIVEMAVREVLSKDLIGKEANYLELINFLQSRLKRKAVVVIIGDFYEDIDISYLAKHQLYLVRVRDHFEEELSDVGEVGLIDPISKKSVEANIDSSLIKSYKSALKKHDNTLNEHILEYGATIGNIYTNDDVYLRATDIFKG